MGTDRAIVEVPICNEAQNIEALVPQILEQDGVDGIVIVDDKSPEGTGQIADRLAEQWSGRIDVVRRSSKLGLSTA